MKQMPVIFALLLTIVGPAGTLADEKSVVSGTQQVTLLMSEYRFEPARIAVKVGKPVELTLVNRGTVMHEFITEALRELEVELEISQVGAETLGIAEVEVPPGEKVILRFTPKNAGEFPLVCESKEPRDHFKEGMSATLVFQ